MTAQEAESILIYTEQLEAQLMALKKTHSGFGSSKNDTRRYVEGARCNDGKITSTGLIQTLW